MLDTLGEIAARLPADVSASNPAFGRMDKILQELLEGFENDIEIFDVVREKLQTLLTEEDQRIEEEAQSTEKQIEQKESLALAKTVAQTEIRVRLRGRKVPRPVLEFLLRQWIKVLLLVQVKEGESSETWKDAIETMDLLIWSVEPKNTLEARRELVDKVPELLRRLVDALKSADIEDAVRSRFIVDLRKLHSEVIASAGRKKVAVPEEASPSISGTPVDSAPPVLSPAIEIDPETAAPPAESVPSLEPTAIEFRAATAAPPVESAPSLEMPSIDFGFLAPAAPGELAPPQEPHAKEAVPAIALVPPDSAPPVGTVPAAKQADPPGPKIPDKQPAPIASGPVEAETLDMSAPVTVTNPFGGGEVEVGDLDFTVQSPSVPTGDKPAPAIPATFVVGTWVAIVRKGDKVERQLARLAFITPLKTRYLFVDRYGKPALECSQTELFRLLRLGEVTITNETVEMPLFDRIVAGLASKLSERR
jgi:hypothetical protein